MKATGATQMRARSARGSVITLMLLLVAVSGPCRDESAGGAATVPRHLLLISVDTLGAHARGCPA